MSSYNLKILTVMNNHKKTVENGLSSHANLFENSLS